MEATQLSVPVTSSQIINLARQLPRDDKKRLLDLLNEEIETDQIRTHWASEQVLGKDWLSETEEKIWQHL